VKLIVLPDLHVPRQDKKSLAAVERYMRDGGFDGGVQLGDFVDLSCISRHVKDDLKAQNQRITEETDEGNRVLDRWQKYVPKWDIIQGNHEYRAEAYVAKNPQVEGVIDIPRLLDLKGRGIKWVPYWSLGKILKYGKANFIHGCYVNKHHANKHVEHYGCNIFYGHCHDVQEYSHVLHGDDSTLVGSSLGCLCDYDQGYNRMTPNRWQQAFGEFHIQPNGFFNHYVVRIFNHKFIAPSGELYDGNKLVKE
jgi:hypothetical protein